MTHFQYRDWVPESGWPIHRDELTAYYKRAHEVCQLLPYDYDTERWSRSLRAKALPLAEEDIETRIYHLGRPPDSGPPIHGWLAQKTYNCGRTPLS